MDSFSNQCDKMNATNHWKNRCISLLKDAEKRKLSAQFPQRERLDLMMKKEKEELKLKSITNKIQEIEKQLDELENKKSNLKNITRSELKLYQYVTKLMFDLDSPPNKLKGFVTGRPLQTFHLDTTLNSNQFIVDYLWKLIDPDSTEKKDE